MKSRPSSTVPADVGSTVDYDALQDRAERLLSTEPRPFLRWAGSKQKLLRGLVRFLPATINRYYEPFLGSAAMFFLLQPDHAVISDSCEDLIRTYEAVRDDPYRILDYVGPLDALDEDLYYEVRGRRSVGRLQRAADFIYLNHACWNGLYRVNSKGQFNVPYGAPRSSNVVERTNLVACARVLSRPGVNIRHGDFDTYLDGIEVDDFVFLDPPYVTGHNNNGFVDYNERLFSWADQIRLAATARDLVRAGANVMITNAYHDGVLNLYKDFDVLAIDRWSTLAGDKKSRRPVKEALIRSYG